MSSNLNLENMNDFQKNLLTLISYFNITDEGRERILNGGLVVYELDKYLDTPDAPFVGDDTLPKEISKIFMETTIGENTFMTHRQLLEKLIGNGLGELVITNISDKKDNVLANGFQAVTFVDSYGNKGFSYRGSDFSILQGAARDWVEADVLEYFTGSSSQVREMLEYFNDNKNSDGTNFIYGYSLGGNLVAHNYLHNYDDIREAFSINGNPINQKLLDTPEKIAAFNDPEKFHCNIIGGDIIGQLKSHELYKNNVRYIKNNDELVKSPISAHMINASTYDENGNFVYITEDEMEAELGIVRGTLVGITQNVREILNAMGNAVSKPQYKPLFEEYRNITLGHLEHLNKHLGALNVNINTTNSLVESFKSLDPVKQQEFIDRLLEQMEKNSNIDQAKVMI